jgi:polyhydroxyalkanoate synthesis regulator phasin
MDGWWNMTYAKISFPYTEYDLVKYGKFSHKEAKRIIKELFPLWAVVCGVREYGK